MWSTMYSFMRMCKHTDSEITRACLIYHNDSQLSYFFKQFTHLAREYYICRSNSCKLIRYVFHHCVHCELFHITVYYTLMNCIGFEIGLSFIRITLFSITFILLQRMFLLLLQLFSMPLNTIMAF